VVRIEEQLITVDRGLSEFRVVRYKRSKNRYEIWLEKRLDFGICPTCGHPTSSYHDGYKRTVQDLPIMGTPVFLHIFRRRYHCPNCKRHFNESFESVDVYQRQTRHLQEYRILLALSEKALWLWQPKRVKLATA